MQKTFDRHNFHKHTFCVFTEMPRDAISHLNPNYTSKSGSSYYFLENGVFRLSNHWGRAANCKWRLKSKTVATERTRLGFANWTEFHTDNDLEKLYFIEVDYEEKTVHYQHRSNTVTTEDLVLRTASETEKIIKQIRNLFDSESWAKHFSMEINLLRQEIIHQMITTNKTLQEIKSELLSKY